MTKPRTARIKAAASAGVMLLTGLGIGVTTASPAAAYTYLGACNTAKYEGAYQVPVPAIKTASGKSSACYMHKGANHAGVGWLQHTLNACYGESLDVDNDFGPATKSALIRAQREEGISADGGYGGETLQNLVWTNPSFSACRPAAG